MQLAQQLNVRVETIQNSEYSRSIPAVCHLPKLINFLGVAYFDVEVSHTPFQRLLMGVEEYVKPVSVNGATPVENFYRLVVFVARNNHFGAEWIFFVSGYKGITRAHFVAAGRYTI